VLLARTAEQHPAVYEDHGIRLEPLPEVLLGDVRRVLALLSLAAAVLVAIAASNAIHLLLARAVDRQRDFALRSALGAGRRRLAAQLFVEGTLLGIGAAAAGLLIAATALRAIDRAFPLLFPAARTPAVDLVEIAFAAVLAGLVGLLLGAAALARTRRVDLAAELRESGPVGTASPRGGALRRLLVATEVTLATSLGICGLLLVLSAHRVAITEPGFEPHRLLTFQISLPYSSYPEQQDEAAFFQRALDRLSAAPEVVSAAASSSLAFGRAPTLMPFAVEGMPRSADRGPFLVIQEAVTGGFFATLGIDVVAGRSFAAGDDGSAAPVALINRTAARRFFGDADPIGRRIAYWDPLFGDDPPDAVVVWRRVVGIVADSRRHSLDAPPQTEVFVPFAQSVRRTMRFVVRTSGDPLAFAPSARRAIWALDGSLPITDLRTQHQIHRDASSGRRFLALLVSILAGLGIALAAVGTYAVVSFAVRRSVRELGVRLAVGADRPDLLRHVLLHHGAAPAAGLAVGLAGGWMASRSVTAYLYQVDAAEPSAFASGLVLVGTAIALACLLPARRAARLDPLRVLRDS
jgi:putative ABC transport system permease protein